MSQSQLKKYLQSLEKTEIIVTVLELYSSHKEVKEYFEYFLNPNEKEQFEKYKLIIDKEFKWAKYEPKMRISVAKKAIADFARLKPSESLLGELMIHFVVVGCQLTFEYGDMSEQFYNSMLTNFNKALKYISENRLLEEFRHEADLCIKYSADCGYGFPYEMDDIFHNYYDD